jgi:hypothetical protein
MSIKSGPGIELAVEFQCNYHNDTLVEPLIQIEGNSAIYNWFGDHKIIHVSKNCIFIRGAEKTNYFGMSEWSDSVLSIR